MTRAERQKFNYDLTHRINKNGDIETKGNYFYGKFIIK